MNAEITSDTVATRYANGTLKVWLADVNGNQYSNTAPVFTNTTTLPAGYNWQPPPSGAAPSSGGMTGRQTREMDIGIRGFGNTAVTVNNLADRCAMAIGSMI